jgi:hypothetical protein
MKAGVKGKPTGHSRGVLEALAMCWPDRWRGRLFPIFQHDSRKTNLRVGRWPFFIYLSKFTHK